LLEQKNTLNIASFQALQQSKSMRGLVLIFWRSIHLGWVFFSRDLKTRHRESFLGLLWTIIPIAVTTLGFYVATKSEVLRPGVGIDFPYVAFVFCGMMFWYLFVDTLLNSVSAMKNSRNLLGRVSFPVLSVFLATAFQSLLDFIIRLALFGVVSVVLGCWNEVSWYLFPPLGALVVIWSLTIALLIVPFSFLVQDMFRFLQIGLEYGVFITPIAFQLPAEGTLHLLMRWNPLTYMIPPARDLILGLNDASLAYLFIGLPIGVILFFLTVSIFNICVPHLVERIS